MGLGVDDACVAHVPGEPDTGLVGYGPWRAEALRTNSAVMDVRSASQAGDVQLGILGWDEGKGDWEMGL